MSKNIMVHAKGTTPERNSPDFLLMKLNSARIYHHIDKARNYSEITGLCGNTANKRKHNIDDMTIKELYAVCGAMGINIEIPELFNNY